jgi:hypothetical protein
MFAFETAVGRGSGVLRLKPDPASPGALRCWTLSTTLQELEGFEERIGARRPTGPSDYRDFGAENWLDKRRKAVAYADRDLTVLVIGAGQAGLAIAARLTQLEVDTLIVERNARIGDNWRRRYRSLALHKKSSSTTRPTCRSRPTSRSTSRRTSSLTGWSSMPKQWS